MGDQIATASRHLHTLTGIEDQSIKLIQGRKSLRKSLNCDPSLPSCWLGYKMNLNYKLGKNNQYLIFCHKQL